MNGQELYEDYMETETCPDCEGDGFIFVVEEDEEKKVDCTTCSGIGIIEQGSYHKNQIENLR